MQNLKAKTITNGCQKCPQAGVLKNLKLVKKLTILRRSQKRLK